MVRKYDIREPVHDNTDHSGETYGKLTILSLEDREKDGKWRYCVRCNVCGTILHNMQLSKIKSEANTKCIHPRLGKYKANWSHQQLRMKYTAMIDRCYNEKCSGYYNYGDRGITVCDEWLNSPQAFNDWAINNGYRVGLTIDRIDNDKGYSPTNCRWVTGSFNTLNRRVVKWMKVDGVENTLADWSRMFGYSRQFFGDYYDKHGKKATKKFIKEHIDAKRRLISERHQYKFNVNGKQLSIDEVTSLLGLKKTHLVHYIQKHGIESARIHVADLIDSHELSDKTDGPLVIKLGGTENG